MAKEGTDWEYGVAYKILDLYVRELTEKRDKRMLDIEGLVESYFYILGRLKVGAHEMDQIVKAVRDDLRKGPESPEESGLKDAVGRKKLSAGLLKALEGM